MILAILYDIVLLLAALIFFPIALIRGKYRKSFWKRLGVKFPKIEKKASPLVWIHAVSLGETRAVAPLVKLMQEERPGLNILFTNITEAGHAEAQRAFPSAIHAYLPIDLSWVIAPIVRRCRPDLVLVTETDLWYQWLKACKKSGAKIAIVNGKISEKSYERHHSFSWFSQSLFSCIDKVYVQSEEYRQRFLSLGITADSCVVTGNTKLDQTLAPLSSQERKEKRTALGINGDDVVIVLGSTHDPEEKEILDILLPLVKKYSEIKIFVVPRHTERCPKVVELFKERNIPYTLWTQKEPMTTAMLVDAMGVLNSCYQIADIAVVCGSYVERVGGHNVTEPCAYGVPVIFGPEMHSQRDFAHLTLSAGAALQVPLDQLRENLELLITHQEKRQEIGNKGLKLFQSSQGATTRTWEGIKREIAATGIEPMTRGL